jgi:hypothetical protein
MKPGIAARTPNLRACRVIRSGLKKSLLKQTEDKGNQNFKRRLASQSKDQKHQN